MATAAFPWGGILYTGLLSTDLALLIEVGLAATFPDEPLHQLSAKAVASMQVVRPLNWPCFDSQ